MKQPSRGRTQSDGWTNTTKQGPPDTVKELPQALAQWTVWTLTRDPPGHDARTCMGHALAINGIIDG